MFNKILDAQYRRPSGLLGQFIGSQMARDHRPENLWTVALLQAGAEDSILELGFGAGVAIQELSRLVTRGYVAGIDFSSTMLTAASRRNAAALREGRVDLRRGDAARLPFEDGSFDKAFSIHSVYFWPRPQVVLEEVHRVLKPGGMFLLTVLPKEKWNAQDPTAPLGTPECTPYSGDELARMLQAAGFRQTRIEADTDEQRRSNYSVTGMR